MNKRWFVLILLLLPGCKKADPLLNKWNVDFVNGKIDQESVQREIPIGSHFKQIMEYIHKYKIPKHGETESTGYEIIYSNEYPAEMEYLKNENKNTLAKYIIIHGHANYDEFPNYYHPMLFFLYDGKEILFCIGQHGYP
jgi:hypothetical protein